MSEIRTPVRAIADGEWLIDAHHTIADIARWIIDQGMADDMLEFLCRPRQLGDEYDPQNHCLISEQEVTP